LLQGPRGDRRPCIAKPTLMRDTSVRFTYLE